MLPSRSPPPPEPRCTLGHSQQEGPHWFGSWALSLCGEQFRGGGGRWALLPGCSAALGSVPAQPETTSTGEPARRRVDSGSSSCGRSSPTQVRSEQRACSLGLLEMEQAADDPLGLSALLLLTRPPRLARRSEACPGRGRGGVLLGADVERSHQPHKSRALFRLKPPKAPAASPGRPRPRPAPWAAWCGPRPLQPCLQLQHCPAPRRGAASRPRLTPGFLSLEGYTEGFV